MTDYWDTSSIGDLTGKTVLVTGANSGLGYYTSKWLAANGAEVIMVCRDRQKGEKAMAKIKEQHIGSKLKLNITDLADLEQVRLLSDWLHQEHSELDILINNAGVMAVPQGRTEQGHELQWGINYLAHFYLTSLVFDLLKLAGGRVVTLSSKAANRGKIHWQDPNLADNYDEREAYQQSKLALLMFSLTLHRRLKNEGLSVKSIAAHPGFSATNLFKPMTSKLNRVAGWLVSKAVMPLMTQSAEKGALSQLYAATSPTAESGHYYGPDGKNERKGYPGDAQIPPQALREEDQDGLWLMTEDILQNTFEM